MTKIEFLKQLKKKLRPLPEKERQRILDYYTEIIEDEMEEGRSEADAVSRRGTVTEIAEQTLRDYVCEHKLSDTEDGKNSGAYYGGRGKRLVIAAVSFPIWLPLYAAGWSVLAALLIAAVSCSLGGAVCLIPSFIMIAFEGAVGWVQTGICFIALGCGVLLEFGSWELTKLWLKMTRWLWRGIWYSFRKEAEEL